MNWTASPSLSPASHRGLSDRGVVASGRVGATAPRSTSLPSGSHGPASECSVCFLVFCGLNGFDAHRTGKYGVSRRCLTVPEMKSAGFTRCELDRWRI